jgi:predicted dehydrogenase
MEPLRIGILGASPRIAGLAVIEPARATGDRVVAVAARDIQRAKAFAAQHGVERVAGSYAELVADPEVEAVYNPLPNGLHGRWNLAAIEAGKHVLSEKPFAANAAEAAQVRDAGRKAGVVVADGFHYFFHPVVRRLHELLESGELGQLTHIEAKVFTPDPGAEDPRWSLELAGGALMDLGCYALHVNRALARWGGGEPRVARAEAGMRAGAPGVDEWLNAELVFPSGLTGSARCHMDMGRFEMTCQLVGSLGTATAMSFVKPHLDDRIIVENGPARREEHLGTRTSYTYQLEAFAAAVRRGEPMPTDADDAVNTMRLIGDCYLAAGMRPRTA